MRPPHPPTRVDKSPSATSSVGAVSWAVCIIRENGASFCQVDKISPVVKSSPWRTSGIHRCIGASPILSARAIITIVLARGLGISVIFHVPVNQAFVVPANKIIAAAVACVRKYLVEASTARGW